MIEHKGKYLLYAGVFVALLPVILLRDFTPMNELRYLSIADEALRNHTFFAFTNHGTPYADKPPLYLWMVMLCRWLTGAHRMWLLALFSILPAWSIVQVMDNWTAHEMDRSARSSARMMLLTSLFFIGSAITLRMDMLMSLFIVLALREFWRMLNGTGDQKRSRLLFPLYLFLAVFAKGPLGLLIPLCCSTVFLVLSGCIRQFFRYWGLRTWGILIVLCLLWFGAVYAEGGPDYLHNLLVHQTVDRAVNSFHHDAPFYYYAISIWYIIAPWSLLIIGVLTAVMRPKAEGRSDLQRFFLTVAITGFLLLSCVSAKLQIYFLPIIPFVIYTAAMFLPRLRRSIWPRIALTIPALIFAVALPAFLIATGREELAYLRQASIYVAAAILSISGICSLYLLYGKRCQADIGYTIYGIGIGLLLAVFTAGRALPALNAYAGYGAVCDKALELSQQYGITTFRTWHIVRPENMDVYLHRPVTVIPDEEQTMPDTNRPFVLLTHQRYLESLPKSREVHLVGPFAVVVYP